MEKSTKNHCIIFSDNQQRKKRTSGAYRIANQLENLNWQTDLIDFISSWNQIELFDYLDKLITDRTKLFAFSYTWLQPKFTADLIKKLKNRYPNKKILIGGQQLYQYDLHADLYLYGYAEKALPICLEYLFNNGPAPKGITPKNFHGGIIVDCNHSYPAMNLKDYSIYYKKNDYIEPTEALTIELSRGCKFKCKYCNYAFLGIKEDTSAEYKKVYNEIMTNYESWGTKKYIIADDTFNDRESKIEMLGDIVKTLPFEIDFSSFIRIDLAVAKPKQFKLLSDARVWAHYYGIETMHLDAGKAIGKGMHPDKIKDGLLKMRKYMMETLGLYRGSIGLIAGLPYEPIESWRETENWCITNWSDNVWHWWPLDISTDSTTTNLSDFSNDWKSYGYRSMLPADIQKFKASMVYSRLKNKKDKNVLYWESDYANVAQATEWVCQTNKNYHIKKLDNFQIINWAQNMPKNKLLNLTQGWYMANIKVLEKQIGINYILRKKKAF